MPLSRLPLPSFAVSLTSSPHGSNAPAEVLSMRDFQQASRRELHINIQPKDSDPLMKTIDTRFAGSFAYTATYSTDKSPRATEHVRQTTAPPSASSSSMDDDDDASSTSTTHADLNLEFEAEVNSNSETASAIGEDDLSDLGLEFEPPLHLPAPSPTGRLPPLHRQPVSLASLTEGPPRYAFEDQVHDDGILMRVLGAESSRPPSPWGNSSVCLSDALRALPRAPASSGLAKKRFSRGILGLVRAVWRRVTVVGSVILHECTKDL